MLAPCLDDEEVQHENLSTAYISWYITLINTCMRLITSAHRYFTLAHELAHNLVQPHNSEHEFYFSAICEKHVQGLGKLLASH
jgi:Zn-dependent peptidase ImmA (M78 family)